MTVYMMRSITIEESAGFREALLELYSVDFSSLPTRLICVERVEMVKTLLSIFRL